MTQVHCPYKNKCGGCLYLDMPTDAYVQKKIDFIKNAFSHENINIEPDEFIIIPFGLRRRVTFAFNKSIVGFNKQKSHEIIPMDMCPAIKKELSDMLIPLQHLTKELRKKGDISLLSTDHGIDIHIKTGKESPSLNERMILADFAVSHPQLVRLTYNNEPIVEKIPLPFKPDIFLQPSKEGENALIQEALSSFQNEKKVADLFCGTGTFTKPLLEKGILATGYDSAGDSVALLNKNGIKRDLFRNPLTARELNEFDGVVLDPPRAGALAQVQELSKSDIKKIVMISCNPITAARDSALLIKSGFNIKRIVGIDQFIYTNHVEIICHFEKLSCNQ